MASAGLLHPQIDANFEEVEKDITEGQYRPNVNNPLLARKRISDVWPAQPPDDHLHVFVSLPRVVDNPALPDGMVLTTASLPEFTMKLRDIDNWDRLCRDDLNHSDIRETRSSEFLQTFQKRLERKRYLSEDVRAVLRCCRPPDFRCSSYLRHS